jgi:hypothetical protein
MNRNLPIVFSIFLLVGIIVPAHAQTISDNVVINEVDINPPLNDALGISEWIELYNPTDSNVSLDGWEIASTTVLKKIKTISPGIIIKPGQFLTFYHQNSWFTDYNEVIELRDANGIVIDKTPALTDTTNDFKSWQRIFDGYGSDSRDDWKFVAPTPGSSNGKLIETQEEEQVTITVSSDKSSYLMDETAIITGSVSEKVYISQRGFFDQATIDITISGPNYFKDITLFPDRDLNFATTLKLQKVLGVNEGIYDVSVTYAEATANTSFSVGRELIALEQKEEGSLTLITDKSQYIPGDRVIITATSTDTIPFEGMEFTVTNNSGDVINSGTLFPTGDRRIQDTFTTTIFIDNITRNYGIYVINAEYFGKSISTTFEVIEDVTEDVVISLWTDKVAYALGDEVKITGRLNQKWVPTLDLLIDQTSQTSLRVDPVASQNMFRHSGGVVVKGDFTFSHSFTIPNSEIRLGDYRIDVSQNVGTASIVIHVLEDPESFVKQTEQLTLVSDKEIYQVGETIRLTGFILEQFETNQRTGADVGITFEFEDGRPLEFVALPKGAKTRSNDGVVVGYHFTAIPERSGSFTTLIPVTQGAVPLGKYTATAEYFRDTASVTITVIDPLEGITLAAGNSEISFDKDVYGLNETVHLTGIIPPTGDTSVMIDLTRPDGTSSRFGADIYNQRFSWSWDTPCCEKTQFLTSDDVRFERPSNFGTYTVRISTDTLSTTIHFKISEDPENESLDEISLFVSTDKSLYEVGERLRITGTVMQREQGSEGLVVPERVGIRVLDGTFPHRLIPGYEATVFPDAGGNFLTHFELPITVFTDGPYTVEALFSNFRASTPIGVVNTFVVGLDEPVALLLATDKSEYHPGETVIIHGKPNQLVHVKKINVSVVHDPELEINCGVHHCGIHSGSVTSYLPGPDGSFTHEYQIRDSDSSAGHYIATADVGFDNQYVEFFVVAKTPTLQSSTVIEKETGITDKIIEIFTRGKTIDDVDFNPRVLSGSLITTRGNESDVNLRVTTSLSHVSSVEIADATPIAHTCLIGPDDDCLVKESTRKPGQIYDVVDFNGVILNVRYSGPDVRLEKFSILPANTAFLPDGTWNVEIIKDEQASKFYYKTTYKTPEQIIHTELENRNN